MKKNVNMWLLLIIISIGGGIIYIFPYLQYTYYDSMKEYLKLDNEQMGTLISVYGALNLIAYGIGGVIADRFHCKNLIVFSLISTGISGFIFASSPSYKVMLLLSIVWSITTTFTYWPAMIKAVKLLGTTEEQGRLFGFRESLFCLFALVFSLIGVLIFKITGENFRILVITYGIIYIISGIITFIFLPNKDSENSNEGIENIEKEGIFIGIIYVLKQPTIWLVGLLIFFAYAIGVTLGRLAPYLTSVFKMGITMAAIISILNEYAVSTIGSAAGGIIVDKIKSSIKTLRYSFIIMTILLGGFVIVPGKPSLLLFAVGIGLSVKLIQSAIRGVYFVPLDEIKIPDKYLGTAIGVVCIIGFSSDAFLFTIWGKILDMYSAEVGYKIIFTSLIGFSILGFIVTLFLSKKLEKNKKID